MMKDCPNGHAEAGVTVVTMMPLFFGHRRGFGRFTVRTFGNIAPSDIFDMGNAVVLSGKHFEN